ncbi:MAG: hypothetical protein IJL07_01775 [Lachnospiraceae bacterium]|nr:hypothetical protein [Lachnospiraceae bacterium]
MNVSSAPVLDMDGFIHALVQSVSSLLGPEVEITTSEQRKNNQVTYPCITLRHPDRQLSPNIRVDGLFASYKRGLIDIDEISERIGAAYDNADDERSELEYLYTDPGKLYDRIIFRLVNYERNYETLDQYPHFRILDLAVIFCLTVSLPGKDSGDVKIDRRIASLLGLDAGQLLSRAVRNTPELFPSSFKKIDELILEILRKNRFPESAFPLFAGDESFQSPMMVLTNSIGFYGASALLYPGVLEKIREELGSEFYVLPSSVNEVIILPSNGHGSDYLRDMVREVNQTTVPPEEILSDNIYSYPKDFDSSVIGPLFANALE